MLPYVSARFVNDHPTVLRFGSSFDGKICLGFNFQQLKKPGSTLKSVNKLKMLALKTEFTKRFDNKIIKNSHQKTIFQQNGNKRARYTYSKVYRFFALQNISHFYYIHFNEKWLTNIL